MAHRGGNSRRNQEVDTTITSVQCDGLVRIYKTTVKVSRQKLKRKMNGLYLNFPNFVRSTSFLLFDVSTHVSICVDKFFFCYNYLCFHGTANLMFFLFNLTTSTGCYEDGQTLP